MSGHTENSVVIAADVQRVWDITNDVSRWPWLYSEYASAEILETAENYVRFRLTTCRDENGDTWSWVSERRLDPAARTVDARRMETGPFDYMTIRWEYRTVPEGVEMRWIQDFHLKPTAPVDDAAMAARINRRTPMEMARIKRLIESGERPAPGEGE
jgi:aromatase